MHPDTTITQQEPTTFSKAWIEDGILYHKYQAELTLTVVLEAERKSLLLLEGQGLRILPIIVFLEDIDKTKFKLTMADYGRVLSTFDLARHASGVWIVGVADEVKKTVTTISGYFQINGIFFADDVKEAQDAAQLFLWSSSSILDPL